MSAATTSTRRIVDLVAARLKAYSRTEVNETVKNAFQIRIGITM